MFPQNPQDCLKTSKVTARLRHLMNQPAEAVDVEELKKLLQDRENLNDYAVIEMWAHHRWAWASFVDKNPKAKAIMEALEEVAPKLMSSHCLC